MRPRSGGGNGIERKEIVSHKGVERISLSNPDDASGAGLITRFIWKDEKNENVFLVSNSRRL